MKDSLRSTQLALSLLATAAACLGCSDDPSLGTIVAGVGPGGARPPLAVANGWASVWPGDATKVTNGGNDADRAHTYVVTTRMGLVKALYPDAVVADNGTFTSVKGPDKTPKLIYVRGTISLNTNKAGKELTLEDHACEGYDFAAFKAAYEPREWNKQPLVDDAPPPIPACPGSQEELRNCSRARQRAVVELRVGSNTSLLGLGDDARIIHGGIVIGGTVPRPPAPPLPEGTPPPTPTIDPELAAACGIDPGPPPEPAAEPAAPAPAPSTDPVAENVIVRNISFEDAYDMFPAWDPTDSYSTPPDVVDPEDLLDPKCQATFDAPSDNGPHQCPGGRWNSEYDNLRVQNATHVWIDHCAFNDGDRESQSATSVWEAPYDGHANRKETHDGVLDINGFADFVTVSNNIFMNHDKVMLIGGSDTVRQTNGWGALSVTVDHNRFIGVGQRVPRVRFGKVHVYSNYVEGTLGPSISVPADRAKPWPRNPMGSGLGVGHLAKVYSENNVYALTAYAGDSAPNEEDVVVTQHRAAPTTGTTPDVNERTYFFDSGTMLNGVPTDLMVSVPQQAARRNQPELLPTGDVWTPSATYSYTPTPTAGLKSALEASAGPGKL